MKIDVLSLRNFRNFEAESFRFPSQFTVIIGENGKGKSSILQGLRVAAATFLLGIDEAERYHIQKGDLRRISLPNRFVPQNDCGFTAQGIVDGRPMTWSRTLYNLISRTDYKAANDLIGVAKTLSHRVNEELDEAVDFPVLGFFSTARLWAESKQTTSLKKKGTRLRDGYARCLDERSDTKSPMGWIKSQYWKKLKGNADNGLLEAVLEAIDTCIPHWTPTEWDEDTDDLGGIYTDEQGQRAFVPLFFLSDGLRTMAAMVAEIAYRCAVLNPHRGRQAVKSSKGIVLIDEIDMHLHPKWQQSVVGDLKRAFPNIQFIATTHSPFIVQSLKAEELINLDRQTDVNPDNLDVGKIATSIMGLRGTYGSAHQQMEDASLNYLALLGQGKPLDSRALEALKDQISDPAVRAFLELQKLKQSTEHEAH